MATPENEGTRASTRKGNIPMSSEPAMVEVFWKAFETLPAGQKRAFAERVLSQQGLMEDVYDHLLIESAKKVRGRSLKLAEYETSRKRGC